MKGVDAGYMHYQYVFIVLNKQMLEQMNSFYNCGFDKLKLLKQINVRVICFHIISYICIHVAQCKLKSKFYKFFSES